MSENTMYRLLSNLELLKNIIVSASGNPVFSIPPDPPVKPEDDKY